MCSISTVIDLLLPFCFFSGSEHRTKLNCQCHLHLKEKTNKRGFRNTLNNLFVLYKLPLFLKFNQVHIFIKIHIHFALPPNYSRAQEKVFFYFLFILFFGHFTFCYKFGGFIELANQIVTSTCHRVIKHV